MPAAPALAHNLGSVPALKQSGKPPKVSRKIAAAIERMVEHGEPMDKAAKHAGLTTHALRVSLSKPHVLKHMKARREVFRDHICAANIHRLAKIRDAANNMPAVNAIKALEQLGEDQHAAAKAQSVPGFIIVCKGDVQVNELAPGKVHDSE